MTPETVLRLDALAGQLAEILRTATFCVQEIQSVVRTVSLGAMPSSLNRCANGFADSLTLEKQRPLIDESTLSVFWNSKKLHLGYTRVFRFLACLARRPNQYVTHIDLLCDVWDDEDVEPATIRSLVSELRRRLRKGGMAELASAIQGHNERYILNL